MTVAVMKTRAAVLTVGLTIAGFRSLGAQAPGHWPPDSLVNTRVISRSTRVIQVVDMMRNFAGDLGVRCQFCHIGQEGQPLEQFDFASDDKRTKLVARRP